MNNIVCPISKELADSNVGRVTIFINVLLLIVFLITKNPLFIILVSIDYFTRAIEKMKLSPIQQIAIVILKPFKLNPKLVGIAPKIFASRLGFLCALSSTVLFFLNLNTASTSIAIMLATLATLDSVCNFCMGCLIYNYLVFPFYKKTHKID